MKKHRLPHEKDIHLPNAATLKKLMEHRGECSVSIYFPTEEAGAETQKNRIHFKNALQDAESRLQDCGADESQVKKTLGPLQGWADDEQRWAHQGHGLAIFLHDGEVETHRLPASVEARTLVGDRYHLLPLIELGNAGMDHYVLCLSLKEPKLVHSSAFSMQELVIDFPSLEDVMGYDTTESHHQGHSTNSNGGRMIHHGHGEGSDEERKLEIRKYCGILDEKIREYLPSRKTPLVIVAVEYVGSIFAEVTDHPTVAGRVDGNPDSFDRAELHTRAFEAAESHLRTPEKQDLERLEEAQRGANMATKVGDVLVAANDGRVDLLLVSDDSLRWGTWDPEKRNVGEAPKSPRTEHDLTDLAAREVLAKGGRVRFVDKDDLPFDEPFAAILRY